MSESRFAEILRPDLAELSAYEPRPGAFAVRLDANEPPPLLSPESSAALARAMVPEQWSRYPDARALELRAAIAATCDASPDEILVGTGSDEVIALLLTALARPRGKNPTPTIVTPTPTFVMYRLSARARGFKVVEVPLDPDWDLDVHAMGRAVDFARPNIVFVATPNNPTGRSMSLDRLEALIAKAPDALVVVDEAYVAYAPKAQLQLRKAHPNVAVLRTLSKIGFASLRVGWMVGPAALVAEIDKTRQPYNLPVPSQRGAVFVLRHLEAEVAAGCAAVIVERARLGAALSGLGFGVTPSDANFLWVETPGPAGDLCEALAARGVLVKSFHERGGRLARRARITVGLPAENDRLLEEVRAVQLARLALAVTAALALAGCPDASVVRVVEGRLVTGRYINEAAYAYFARGAAAEAAGNPGGALRAYTLAADEDPRSPDVWTRLAALHCRLAEGDAVLPALAADAFARAQAVDPSYGPLYRERARCLAARGQPVAARDDAERALALDPDDLDTALVRADVLGRTGLRDEAVRALRAAAARRPASSEPWRALLDLARRTGDAALAHEADDHLAALSPGPARRAQASLSTVDAALRSGDLAEAQRRALALRVPGAEVALRAAALGLAGLAREQATLVLGADPGDASARIALAAAADLGSDLAALGATMRTIPRRSTAPSALGRWLFADVLRRRVGAEAALAWLGATGAGSEGDPLVAATEKRVREALATP